MELRYPPSGALSGWLQYQEGGHAAWNGQPPVHCNARPQEKYIQRGEKDRARRPPPLPADIHTKALLSDKATETSYAFSFPDEATDYTPETIWYSWVRVFLATYVGRAPGKPPEGRNFVGRVARDGVLLSKLMCTMVSDRWPEILNKVPWQERDGWDKCAQRLRVCCNTKPDLFHFGWVELTDDVFKSKFQGRDEVFLHHMFEKFYGETIEIERRSKGPTMMSPWSDNMHHPQLFVDAHRDKRKNRAMKEAIDLWDSEFCRAEFAKSLGDVWSGAFTPRGPVMCFRCLVRMEGSCKHCLFCNSVYFSTVL